MIRTVVDTNVLVQSCNPRSGYHDATIEFIGNLRESGFCICVDEGLHFDESQNRSRIWSEYTQHIPDQSLARELLTELLISDRVFDICTKVTPKFNRYLVDKVPDSTDRIFVKVSFNGESRSLVSHDFDAFPEEVRIEMRAKAIANIVICTGEGF